MRSSAVAVCGMVIAATTLAVCLRTTAQQAERETAVGDVVYSLLEPDEFNAAHKGRWVLLAGQATPEDSPLRTKFPGSLPDARGVFIRGMLDARTLDRLDASEATRKVGSHQDDGVGAHQAWVISVDLEVESKIGSRGLVVNRGDLERLKGLSGVVYSQVKADTNPKGELLEMHGAKETRPRNISMYIYVRVR